MYIVRYGMCVCICMFVGEHVCRPSLLCNPVHDKIDNNNNNNNISGQINMAFTTLRIKQVLLPGSVPRGQLCILWHKKSIVMYTVWQIHHK